MTAFFADRADIALRYWVLFQTRLKVSVEASTSLNKAVKHSIEGPAVNKVFTAVSRVEVVLDDFDRLFFQGCRLE